MDDESRWLQDRKALGFSHRGEAQALLTFRGMPGRKFNDLTVRSYVRIYPRAGGGGGETVWLCECSCPGKNTVEARYSALTTGSIKSCGHCNETLGDEWTELLCRRLALSLEFEGCIGIYDINGYCLPKVVIGVRDYSAVLVKELCAQTGLGAVTYSTHAGGMRVAQWQVAGSDAKVLAKQVLPFMVCKRRQVNLVLEFPGGRQGARLTPEMKSKRIALEVETKELNKRGPKEADVSWTRNSESWLGWARTAELDQRMDLLAWAIEWEGQIVLNERVQSMSFRGVSHQLGIGLRQVTHRKALLVVVRALAGNVGKVYDMQARPRPGEAPCSSWEVGMFEEARALASGLKSKLFCKKRLAEIICEFPRCDTKPVPDAIFEHRRRLAAEAAEINALLPIDPEA